MNLTNDSVAFYDGMDDSALRNYAERRRKYIETVDGLIVRSAGKRAAILDAGAGDGVRGMRLARVLGVKDVTLMDNSPEMARRCGVHPAKVVCKSVEDRPEGVYDLVLCLWNVFGHVEDRLKGLRHLSEMLAPGGMLYIDVNNRYNVEQYGLRAVARNVVKDACGMDGGYFQIRNPSLGTGRVYIHHPWELERLASLSSLRVVDKRFVNYSTGRLANPFWGQVYYAFSH